MRKAGEPVHCTWIPAVRDLGEALEQLNPELLVCAYVSEADAKQAATVRDQLAPQVPMLLVRPQISEGDIAVGMRLGARDVVSFSATERVQAVVSRELRSFRLERALNTTLQSASDYRRQLQSVLQRSNDAILQVQEGIVVDANQTWLELFGYTDAERRRRPAADGPVRRSLACRAQGRAGRLRPGQVERSSAASSPPC